MTMTSRFLQDRDPETQLWRKIDPKTGEVVAVRPAMWKTVPFTDAYVGHVMRGMWRNQQDGHRQVSAALGKRS